MSSPTMLLLVLLSARSTLADFVPTAPSPGDIFNVGQNCTIQWTPDEAATWTNVTINLMSGSNTAMEIVQPVVSGLDGSSASFSPYNWTCPQVSPNSAIYFYQFTNGDDVMNSKWTTRFTIASPSGETTPPENATQANGDTIPWGHGAVTASFNQSTNDMNDSKQQPSSDHTVEESDHDRDRHIHTHDAALEDSDTSAQSDEISNQDSSSSPIQSGMKKVSSTALSQAQTTPLATNTAKAAMVHFSAPSTTFQVEAIQNADCRSFQPLGLLVQVVFLATSITLYVQ